MKTLRIVTLGLLGLLSVAAQAQSWSTNYLEGIKSAKAGNWDAARKSFQAATANRPEDASAATMLPGPPTEQRKWRNGAAYSPNFLAAYSLYRKSLATNANDSAAGLKTAAEEFETLLSKKQFSRETFYVLSEIYAKTGETQKRATLAKTLDGTGGNLTWRVETELFTPEEISVLQSMAPGAGTNPQPGNTTSLPGTGYGGSVSPLGGTVPVLRTKFALIISNSESRMKDGAISHANEDGVVVKDALASSAGYAPENIDVVSNGTASQMLKAAQALVQRMPEESSLFVFYTGQGVNLNGVDYLAGIDTELPTDSSSMLAKEELYKIFRSKGVSIYAFFQVPRQIREGRYFGQEVPTSGRLAQSHGTLPGDTITSVIKNGKEYGLYADAIAQALTETRTNNVVLKEFCWQVFYKTRKGGTGGSVRQTPTLPQTVNLDASKGF